MGLLDDLEIIQINVASPLRLLEWSHGEVTKPEHICCMKKIVPELDGLCCEKVFGASKEKE